MNESKPCPCVLCRLVELVPELRLEAAYTAIAENPGNRPNLERVAELLPLALIAMHLPGEDPPQDTLAPDIPGHLAVLTSKFWNGGGVKLAVAFTEPIAADLRDRILSHANTWGETSNINFVWSQSLGSAQLRVTREQEGHWSYLGTDNLLVPRGQPTMCLQRFTMNTPESEFRRVVPHEFGHACGFPHEHLRREIIDRIDVPKAVAWYASFYGWKEQTVRQQVLTPLSESSIQGSPGADRTSIMCYHLPGEIMLDGKDVPGGIDLDATDREYAAKLYPKAAAPVPPPPPPPPPVARSNAVLDIDGVRWSGTLLKSN